MKIAMVAFEGFTDVDLFLPWDLFHRVRDATYAAYDGAWEVRICADEPRFASYSGLAIDRHEPLAWAAGADAVFVVSGPGSRIKIKDPDTIQIMKDFMANGRFSRGVEVIDRMINGEDREGNYDLLHELCDTMEGASLCAMGGMTPYPVRSVLKYFAEDFAAGPVRGA